MSVLACNRAGCEHIMCDFYSLAYGYICYECLQELKQIPARPYFDFDQIVSSFMRGEISLSPKISQVDFCDYVETVFKSGEERGL